MVDTPAAAAPPATPASVAPMLATPGATLYEPIPPRSDAAPEPAPAPIVDPPADTPPVEAAPPEAPAPDAPKFDLKLPDGFQADPAVLSKFQEALSTEGLTAQERGQKLIDLYVQQQQEAASAQEAAWNKTQGEWVAELEADPAIGGSNKAKTQETLGKAFDSYGSQEARDAFAMTGAGNNPAIVRMIHKMAVALSEGSYVKPNGPAARNWQSQTRGEVLYGSPQQPTS